MSNLIVRAEKEVIVATNYWQNSTASKFISDAIRELSRRAGQRGSKVVVKVIYDRGSPKQLIEPHYIVPEKTYTGKDVGLPHPNEIPNIDLEVMNYHHPMLGTFHAKYMVVDRKIAILQSDNIQDNDNLEMMVHLEGPIVDSVYDMALISWHKKLQPALPSHNTPAVAGGLGCFGAVHESLFGPDGQIKGYNAIVDPKKMAPRDAYSYEQVTQPGLVSDGQQKGDENHDRADIVTGPTTTASLTHPHPRKEEAGNSGGSNEQEQAAAAGKQGTQERGDTPSNEADRDTKAYLNTGNQEIPQSQIQDPSPQGNLLPEHTTDDPHWDEDIAGEIARVQTAVSAKPGETRMQAVNRHLNHTINVGFPYDAPECAPEEEMTPYIPHPPHEPFPIAMVNRPPYGTPNHKSVSTPQNAAWLCALRNAKKNVFIQSPTVNAEPLIPAIIEACERGIDVYCYVCLGYNDAASTLGIKLFSPLMSMRKRSCHIKLMIVDEHIGIVGSGNQDTQSWFHSQEVNVLLDNPDVCRAWIDGLRRNQNTHLYGAVSKEDGEWRDKDGNKAKGAIGPDPGRFSWTTGIVGAVKRLQGTGGF
ncbi:putative iq calmodulin-binding motif protein [Phaeoacremonium minimum UCRPA7]|uniref:Putative iq calmodulin-binding motif protein n=1 Tax=Phaeoacremonium minimum (strain UCR-PA7) TaxID=1286976 RepID=R8BPC0_PHAM7|nr:putative iq calmodulin-binding motif protein [Phaeoacremonium minimum UCRPA7]EOO01145.1 putative iq calmodulin-binding motif protein [Phaeoacremonium minimum UCRPA7]